MFQWFSYTSWTYSYSYICHHFLFITHLLVNKRPVKFHLLDMDLQNKLSEKYSPKWWRTYKNRTGHTHTQTSPNKQTIKRSKPFRISSVSLILRQKKPDMDVFFWHWNPFQNHHRVTSRNFRRSSHAPQLVFRQLWFGALHLTWETLREPKVTTNWFRKALKRGCRFHTTVHVPMNFHNVDIGNVKTPPTQTAEPFWKIVETLKILSMTTPSEKGHGYGSKQGHGDYEQGCLICVVTYSGQFLIGFLPV